MGYPELLAIAESYLPSNSSYVLLGESFSGPISVDIASRNPTGLKGLILVNTFLTDPRPLLGKFIHAVPNALLQNPPRYLLKLVSSESEKGINVAGSLQDVLAELSPELIRARLGYIASVNVIEAVPGIGVPVAMLRSTRDWAVPKKSMKLLSRASVDVSEIALPGNHFILQSSPNKSAKIIERFCEN